MYYLKLNLYGDDPPYIKARKQREEHLQRLAEDGYTSIDDIDEYDQLIRYQYEALDSYSILLFESIERSCIRSS